MTQRSSAYGLMALHVSLAAINYVLAKPAAVEFADPEALAMARAAAAAVLMVALTGTLVPRPRFTLREWGRIAVLGALLIANQYLFVRGLKDTVPSHPPLLYALTPVVVLLMSMVVERRLPSRTRVIGVLTALAGVATLLRPWEAGADAAALRRGDLVICVAVVLWGVYTMVAKRLSSGHDMRVVTAWSLVCGAIVFAPFGTPALLDVDFGAVSAQAWAGLACLVIVASTIMMFVWNVMLTRLEPVQVAISANAQPVATALLAAGLAAVGYLQGNQDLGPLFWIGTALVLAGVWLVQRKR
jgi:drug/metabolite transporter (DMT)-like permease